MDVIYDFGSNNGDDIPYYLTKETWSSPSKQTRPWQRTSRTDFRTRSHRAISW